jgi:hypothetical protein
MTREDAIKKLGKLLGKHFGYRVDRDAPGADERAEAKAQLPALQAAEKLAEDAMEARRRAILAADREYQELVAACKVARDGRRAAAVVTSRFRITVGTTSDLFFHVKAQGDSWEDVIAQLTQRVRA